MPKILFFLIILGLLLLLLIQERTIITRFTAPLWEPYYLKMHGQATVEETVQKLGKKVKKILAPSFKKAGLAYPPQELAILAFKRERRLEIWGWEKEKWHYLKAYPILEASGKAGPKLKEGDRQVPEGFYRITGFNPNGNFYLTLILDYPNAFDRLQAEKEGRKNLGSEICIHGGSSSVGCLAMGDPVSEELFILCEAVGLQNVQVLICPNDFRLEKPLDEGQFSRPWVRELYEKLQKELKKFPRPLRGVR